MPSFCGCLLEKERKISIRKKKVEFRLQGKRVLPNFTLSAVCTRMSSQEIRRQHFDAIAKSP
jgi:hypothetical protein